MTKYMAFCKIIELGSFTKAADVLGYTQAGISQMIRSLEEELSLTLLIRTRTGIKLTPEGEILYPLIQKKVYMHRVIIEKAHEIKGLKSGKIRVGTFTSVSQHWLPRLIKNFNKLYPDISFVLHQGDYISIQEWIKSGKVDFGFLNPAAVSGLKTIDLAQDPLLAILPLNHPLAKLDKVPLSLLATEPFLLIEEGNISTPLEAFTSAGLTPNIKFRIHDDYAILSMVEQGIGVSILPAMVLDRTNYRFKALSTSPSINRTISIAFEHIAALPIAAQYFINYLTEHLPEQSSYYTYTNNRVETCD